MKDSDFQLIFDVIKEYCEKQELKSSSSQNPWRRFQLHKDELEDDQNYLVSYIMCGKKYSKPHFAYWSEGEERFFSLETTYTYALQVDIFMEIPKFPE